MMLGMRVLLAALLWCGWARPGSSIEWKYSYYLDNNFLVLWTPGESDVTFEIQVKTLGYAGLGFTRNDRIEELDLVVGWVDDNGQVHLQDRHVKGANRNPQMDSSQDYHLQSGYENKTHTVLRFNRRYDTCDSRDLKITNDTLQVVWQYHVDEPVTSSSPLPLDGAVRGRRPLYIVQRDFPLKKPVKTTDSETIQTWDLLNDRVRLPIDQDTLMQCRVFRLPKILRKHHVIKFEPVIQSGSQDYLQQMILYECRGNESILESARLKNGSDCNLKDKLHLLCTTIAASWSLGSEGFVYPPQAGYPLEPFLGPRFYMLETHYTNSRLDAFVSDSSGLRLSYTDKLRSNDAGTLSVGVDPNWRHIIPPGHAEVVSEGHCISKCTDSTIPLSGINVFAVVAQTHELGKKARLRRIRQGRELAPVLEDSSYDPSYQEFRSLQKPVKMYPGDHLIAECTYSSRTRQVITLGGLSPKEETCLVSVLYYPRIDLSLCYSLPSLPTVLHSLGIDKLEGPSPLKISSPARLRGMTLEERLVSYDWQKDFQSFQDATRSGTFKALCSNTKGAVLPETSIEVHYPRILWPYQEPKLPCTKKPHRNRLSMLLSADNDINASDTIFAYNNGNDNNSVENEQLVSNKIFRSVADQSSLSGTASTTVAFSSSLLMLAAVISACLAYALTGR